MLTSKNQFHTDTNCPSCPNIQSLKITFSSNGNQKEVKWMSHLLHLCQTVYGKYGRTVRKNTSLKCTMPHLEILAKSDRTKAT